MNHLHPHHRTRRAVPLQPGTLLGSQHDDDTSVFERWMRRWIRPQRTELETRGPLSEQRRVMAVRRLIATDLSPHSAEFSSRDMRLYLCLTSAPALGTLVRLRFDLFDLLCRYIGEGTATARLHEIDTWLMLRR